MERYWAWEYGTGDKKNVIELVRADDAQRALDDLKAQLAAWQTGKMHICLICGRDKPCMTDEEAIAEGGPGKPCTFDPTPRELFDENKRLKAQLAASQAENSRLIGMAAQHALADTEGKETT